MDRQTPMKTLTQTAGNMLMFGLAYALGTAVRLWDKAWHR